MIHSAAQHSFSGEQTDLQELVRRGATVLDVRTPAEFADQHVPGATNIPVQELSERLAELGATDRPLIVYCRSGARSASAAALLRAYGFNAVHDVGGLHNALNLFSFR